MYYSITYNYNGEIKELSTICVDYESLVHSLNLDKNFKLEKIELSIIGKCQKCI